MTAATINLNILKFREKSIRFFHINGNRFVLRSFRSIQPHLFLSMSSAIFCSICRMRNSKPLIEHQNPHNQWWHMHKHGRQPFRCVYKRVRNMCVDCCRVCACICVFQSSNRPHLYNRPIKTVHWMYFGFWNKDKRALARFISASCLKMLKNDEKYGHNGATLRIYVSDSMRIQMRFLSFCSIVVTEHRFGLCVRWLFLWCSVGLPIWEDKGEKTQDCVSNECMWESTASDLPSLMQSIRLTRQYFAFYLPPFVDPPQILHNVFRFEVWTHNTHHKLYGNTM